MMEKKTTSSLGRMLRYAPQLMFMIVLFVFGSKMFDMVNKSGTELIKSNQLIKIDTTARIKVYGNRINGFLVRDRIANINVYVRSSEDTNNIKTLLKEFKGNKK